MQRIEDKQSRQQMVIRELIKRKKIDNSTIQFQPREAQTYWSASSPFSKYSIDSLLLLCFMWHWPVCKLIVYTLMWCASMVDGGVAMGHSGGEDDFEKAVSQFFVACNQLRSELPTKIRTCLWVPSSAAGAQLLNVNSIVQGKS